MGEEFKYLTSSGLRFVNRVLIGRANMVSTASTLGKLFVLISTIINFALISQQSIRFVSSQQLSSDQFLIRSDFPPAINATDANSVGNNAGHNQYHGSHHNKAQSPFHHQSQQQVSSTCTNGLLTFELSTGFIYKPSSVETLVMMPSTLQLTDCLDYCLHNDSCLAINFEMGLCVLLSSSAKQNPSNLYTSQFPVFTIYAEKKCLLAGDPQALRQKRRCKRAWTFERVAGYEMKTKPKRRLKLASKELCMEACLTERDFECRSANWYKHTGECTLSEQDRHSVSQSEVGDQQIKMSALQALYGPSNLTSKPTQAVPLRPAPSSGLYENYYVNNALLQEKLSQITASASTKPGPVRNRNVYRRSSDNDDTSVEVNKFRKIRQLFDHLQQYRFNYTAGPRTIRNDELSSDGDDWPNQYVDQLSQQQQQQHQQQQLQQQVVDAPVDYLENNCIYEPNKLCEFRKIQNRVLKTVDSIYQDVASVDECKQKCLNAPYRCYSFDYGDTSERVCRTSHLDQASLLAVKEPYLDVVGAITYELAACFNVTIQCRAKEMVALVSSSKMFKGKIYAKSRPSTCVNDVGESLKFELSMTYNDEACNVKSSSNLQQGVFSNDIVIQHHDRIVTTQDVGLSVYCQYDLGNRSITNNVDLAIERIEPDPMESKHNQVSAHNQTAGQSNWQNDSSPTAGSSASSPLLITGLATTVVKSPNVTMRITNMNGQPVTSATVGDRLALLFEIKEKSSPFGIFVREIVAMDGKQIMQNLAASNAGKSGPYYYHNSNGTTGAMSEQSLDYMIQTSTANSIQFIDSDGCPTDANIMGPLIKMDPNGHRILAPFDAFKFPSSDMVFFRAVVTSCVSECAPVICPGAREPTPSYTPPSTTNSVPATTHAVPTHILGTQRAQSTARTPGIAHSHGNNDLMMANSARTTTIVDMDTTRLPQLPSSTTHEQFERIASTPQMYSSTLIASQSGIPVSSTGDAIEFGPNKSRFQSQSASSGTTTTSPSTPASPSSPANTNPTTMGPSTTVFTISTTSMPQTTASEAQSTSNGDSMTTVPGFNGPDNGLNMWLNEQLNSNNLNEEQLNLQQQSQPQQLVNMTNNHHGKAPPRPSTTMSPSSKFNLDSMSEEEKQQIVNLFKAKLRQPSEQQNATSAGAVGSQTNANNLSELDFYTGIFTSLLLKGINNGVESESSSSEDGNYKRDDNNGNNSAHNGHEKQSAKTDGYHQVMSDRATGVEARPTMAELEAILSLLSRKSNASSFDDLIQRLELTLDTGLNNSSSGLHHVNGPRLSTLAQDQPSGHFHQPIAQSNQLQLEPWAKPWAQQSFEDNQLQPQTQPAGTTEFNSVNQGQQQEQDSILKQIRSQQQQQEFAQKQQQKATGGGIGSKTMANNKSNQSVAPKAANALQSNNNTSAAQAQKQRKRDKVANLQALADSYLGALQSMGKKRRKRNLDGDQGSDLSLPGYVYMEQQVAPSAQEESSSASSDLDGRRFTQAMVEMYHTNADEDSDERPSMVLSRFKRQAQPSYDMDELVVQSIKIVDRLHFEDESQDGVSGSARRNKTRPSAQSRQNLHKKSLVTHSSSLTSSNQEELEPRSRLVSWSSAGVLSIVIMAVSFVFVQVFLVAIYLLDCSRRKALSKISRRNNNVDSDYSTWGTGSESHMSQLYNSMSALANHTRTATGLYNYPMYTNQSQWQPGDDYHQYRGQ